jgi:hypothetical protein
MIMTTEITTAFMAKVEQEVKAAIEADLISFTKD